MKARRSYAARAVIASVTLFYVLRLYEGDGQKAVGHEARTVMLWLVGLMNTAWARPGAQGTWRRWVGVALLALAVVDTVALFRKERKVTADSG